MIQVLISRVRQMESLVAEVKAHTHDETNKIEHGPVHER